MNTNYIPYKPATQLNRQLARQNVGHKPKKEQADLTPDLFEPVNG